MLLQFLSCLSESNLCKYTSKISISWSPKSHIWHILYIKRDNKKRVFVCTYTSFETIERCLRTYKDHLKWEHTSRTSTCSDRTSHTSHIQVNTNKHPSFLFVPPLPTLSTTLSLSLSFSHAGIKKVTPNMKSLSARFALSTYASPPPWALISHPLGTPAVVPLTITKLGGALHARIHFYHAYLYMDTYMYIYIHVYVHTYMYICI